MGLTAFILIAFILLAGAYVQVWLHHFQQVNLEVDARLLLLEADAADFREFLEQRRRLRRLA